MLFKYSLDGGRLSDLFDGVQIDPTADAMPSTQLVLETIATRIPKFFGRTITAIDPSDETNTRDISVEEIRSLITVHYLRAQRGLDDEKERPRDLIGKAFQALFDTADQASDGTRQKATAAALTMAVSEVESQLGLEVSSMMRDLVPTLSNFGYPGLNNPELEAVTSLDVSRLLAKHTSIKYRSVAGVSLPESYSGLGSRNLILMLFMFLGFYRDYAKRAGTPGLHLVFIEEPEAHLHPQMQEVFIEQLSSIATLFPNLDESPHPWTPQFVVSTHSPHVANRAEFAAVRYFRISRAENEGDGNHAEVLDLGSVESLDSRFLHQYLTLTRSDLFFADKAILVEGTTERLMVPVAIRKSVQGLANQYVTLMEVGGAYAYKFFPLLDFLGLPALIITDIDAVGGNGQATTVSNGQKTSNETIKKWFASAPTTKSLLSAAGTDQIRRGNRYLAYQVPEQGSTSCGRTFEDAFILANPKLTGFTKSGNHSLDERKARDLAAKQKKSAFALYYAIEEDAWSTPLYIQRGLEWLLAYPSVPDTAARRVEATGVDPE